MRTIRLVFGRFSACARARSRDSFLREKNSEYRSAACLLFTRASGPIGDRVARDDSSRPVDHLSRYRRVLVDRYDLIGRVPIIAGIHAGISFRLFRDGFLSRRLNIQPRTGDAARTAAIRGTA